MRITERRLRNIIRQVIKESRLNEMESPFGMDSYMGAAGAASKNALMELVYPEEFYGSDPAEYPPLMAAAEAVGLSTTLLGMLVMHASNTPEGFLTGTAIAAGAGLWMMIDNYLTHGHITGPQYAKQLKSAQQKIERECPECLDDIQ